METRRAAPASLRMAEPAELVGDWEIVAQDRRCLIRLEAARVEAANAYVLTGMACIGTLLPAPVAGWRPAPDGIELVGADRRTLVLFADQGDGSGSAALPGGKTALRRAR